MSYSSIKFENEKTVIPTAICNYYMSHGYLEKGIPLNADTCREIARILDEGGE